MRKARRNIPFVTLGLTILGLLVLPACNREKNAQIMFDDQGDCLGGTVTGGGLSGGTKTESRSWYNSRSTAEVNMDITSVRKGELTVELKDASGNVVFSHTLTEDAGDDTFSGLTQAGVPGTWTVTVSVRKLKGDGSFSVCPGN